MPLKWKLDGHPENVSTITWSSAFRWMVTDQISAAFITHPLPADRMHAFANGNQVDDAGNNVPWFSRRWRLEITELPDSAWFPQRSVQATFVSDFTQDTDGTTFGEISVWEHLPDEDPENESRKRIYLEVDFTKVGGQRHPISLHVLILHNTRPSTATVSERKKQS